MIVSTLPDSPERRRVEHPPARRGDVAHAVALHGQQAHLAGGAEAVLDAAEHAVLAEALPLEVEHHVDHVLQGARPGDGALLGDVPHEEHGHPGALGHVAHAQHRGANLGDAPWRTRRAGVAERLDGVDHDQGGALCFDRGDHGVHIGLRQQANPGTGAPKPPSSQGKLLKRLLTGAVQRR